MKTAHVMLVALLALIAGCVGTETPPTTTPQDTSTIAPEPTTTTVQSTTTTESTTTTVATSTTATSTTQRKPVTTSSTTTSTTLKSGEDHCKTTADCGGEKTYLACNNNKVYRFTQRPVCQQSPDGSYCVSNQKSTIVEVCSEGDFCVNGACAKKTVSNGTSTAAATTTTATLKMNFPFMSTTTNTIPAATTCMGRSASGSARSSGDCSSLSCGGTAGGIARTCTFIPGEGDTGHCACK